MSVWTKMCKRVLPLGLVAAMLIVGFAGCSKEPASSGSESESGQTETKEFEPTSKTIKLAWVKQYWESDNDLQYLFDGFAQKYPGYTLEINKNMGETSKLLAEIQAGSQPDLFFGADPNWATYVTGCYQRVFQPLDDYLQYDEDFNTTTLPENLLNSTKFYPDGRHYAIPYNLSAYCLSYNRTMFEDAGLDPDDPPETWSEWLEYSNKLVKFDSKGVVTQLGIASGHPYGYIINPLRKQDVFTEDGLHSLYNQQYVVDNAEYVGKFDDLYNGKLPTGDNAPRFEFLNKNVAMDENTNLFDLNSRTVSGIDFDICILPHPDDYTEEVVPALLWMYLAIPTGASNPNGGWLFAKYACTDGKLAAMAKSYAEQPNNFTPAYIIHTPTRERAYDLYMGKVDEKTKTLIEKRDALIAKINYYVPYPPIQNKKATIEERWSNKQIKEGLTLKATYEGIHNEMEATLDSWRKEMEAQGWNFPTDGKPYFERK